MFEKLKYPSKMGLTMAHFKSTDGLVSSQQVDTGLDTYGPNK